MARRVVDVRVFEGDEFDPVHEAEAWCAERGISVGTMQRGSPRGLYIGDAVISKWRNLSKAERNAMDGVMTGGRGGPVVVKLYVEIPKSYQKAGD